MSGAGARRVDVAADPAFAWARPGAPGARALAALNAVEPDAARFVGGCVRDALRGLTPGDVDVATRLEPPVVAAALDAAGLKSAPTGLAHGTLTAIVDGQGVEVTTLRADVATDGRRAVVAFTRDWATDAARRDFRLNAIYLGADGVLHDSVDGLADVRAGRVRFIGDPVARIREDYLRILRFFRFSARFADAFDEPGLAACAAERAGIARLSAERVGDEFTKTLALARAAVAVRAMDVAGVLGAVWPEAPDIDAFARLKDAAPDAPAALGLAVLYAASWRDARRDGAGRTLAEALRLSNADAARAHDAAEAAATLDPLADERAVKERLYRLGAPAFADALTVRAAQDPDAHRWSAHTALAAAWSPPDFPLKGADVVARGVAPGPAVTRTLNAAEDAWIEADYPPRDVALSILDTLCASAST
ncbi:MAG: CCA tRNA nucleotidyltransferase [Pseudomonadota bacterium]